jgi:hypothetical protein
VITNLETEHDHPDSTTWAAWGYWRDVVDTKGEKFLHYHFYGIGQKQRDLTGVRPEGVIEAKEAARAWMLDIVRSGGV